MKIQTQLDLRIPDQAPAPKGALLSNPKDVEKWVSELPLASVGESSKQLFKALLELNRLALPPVTRLKVIKALLPPLAYIADNLKKYFYDSPFPLTEKQRKVANFNRQIFLELATAYKVCILNLLQQEQTQFDPKLLVVTLYHAGHCLERVIYQSALVYDPPPERAWLELHQIYLYAEQNKIQTIPVSVSGADHNDTIEALYQRALLFSICAPHQLRQRDMDQVHRRLPEWIQQITMGLPTPGGSSRCQFIVRLSADQPAAHQDLQTKAPSKRCRQLDTSKLHKQLEAGLATPTASAGQILHTKDTQKVLPHHLLTQLAQSLSSAPKRKFVRTRLNFELRTAVGLQSIHAILQNQEEPEPPTVDEDSMGVELDWLNAPSRNALLRSSLYTLDEQNLTIGDMDQPMSEVTDPPPTTQAKGKKPGSKTDQPPLQEIFPCRTVNESAGGYCIDWQGGNVPRIKVGEVLGIQSASDETQFGVGISRWMKHQPRQALLLGLQIIAPSSVAINVSASPQADSARASHIGLLLPEQKASNIAARLMIPVLPYGVGDSLWISDGTGERLIRLTHLIESSGAFVLFEYQYVNY